MTPDTSPAATTTSRANLALGLGLAALVTWFIAIAITGENGDDNGWIWVVMRCSDWLRWLPVSAPVPGVPPAGH